MGRVCISCCTAATVSPGWLACGAVRVSAAQAEAKTTDEAIYRDFFHAMLARGVYLAPSAYEAGFVSAAHGPREVELTIQAAREAFAELKAA